MLTPLVCAAGLRRQLHSQLHMCKHDGHQSSSRHLRRNQRLLLRSVASSNDKTLRAAIAAESSAQFLVLLGPLGRWCERREDVLYVW